MEKTLFRTALKVPNIITPMVNIALSKPTTHPTKQDSPMYNVA
jgi:hypothetical protein